MEYIFIIISAVFVNNIVLARFLGICPFSRCIDAYFDSYGHGCRCFIRNDIGHHGDIFDQYICFSAIRDRFYANDYLYPCDRCACSNGRNHIKKRSARRYIRLQVYICRLSQQIVRSLGLPFLLYRMNIIYFKVLFSQLQMLLDSHQP